MAEHLAAYLERTGVGSARATPGNQGAMLLRRPSDGDTVEFWLLTFWESLAAVQAFAGEDTMRAVLYPEDLSYFTRADEQVLHFDVVTKE